MKQWKAGQLVTLKYENKKFLCRVVKSKDRHICPHCSLFLLSQIGNNGVTGTIGLCKKVCSRGGNRKMPYEHYFKVIKEYE